MRMFKNVNRNGGLSWGKMEERASNREEEAEFVVPCINPVTSFHAFFMLS